jgi:dihydrofolate reductase
VAEASTGGCCEKTRGVGVRHGGWRDGGARRGTGFDRAGWAFPFDRGDEGHKFKLDEVLAAEALLLGRITYEGFAAAWPRMTDDVGFADKMNSMPKYVVSTTLTEPGWHNTRVLGGDAVTEVRQLKQAPGGDLLVNGSGHLVRTLAAHNLVDEYRLMVFPVVLGSGKRLFGNGATTDLGLEAGPVGPAGVVVLTDRPAITDATVA